MFQWFRFTNSTNSFHSISSRTLLTINYSCRIFRGLIFMTCQSIFELLTIVAHKMSKQNHRNSILRKGAESRIWWIMGLRRFFLFVYLFSNSQILFPWNPLIRLIRVQNLITKGERGNKEGQRNRKKCKGQEGKRIKKGVLTALRRQPENRDCSQQNARSCNCYDRQTDNSEHCCPTNRREAGKNDYHFYSGLPKLHYQIF